MPQRNKVTLQFKKERDLIRFHAIVNSDYIEMNRRTLTLVATYEERDIELAVTAFHATLIDFENARE
jgi:hypothetical protein